MRSISDLRVVATSSLVSVADVTLNLVVALITGSTVMLSQALQGLSDLVTGGLLLVGVRRSRRKADARFQFGYGREIFFWVLIASMIMFVGTGVLSLFFGYRQIVDPEPVNQIWLAFAMLTAGLVGNGYAFSLSLRRLRNEGVTQSRSWWQQLRQSSLIETKATFIIDFVGTTAAALGLISLGLYQLTGFTRFDGIGAIAIGLTMMSSAVLVIWDLRELIVGRGVDPQTSAQLIRRAVEVDGVSEVLDLLTMYVGSSKLFVVMELHLNDGYTTNDIERITDEVKDHVRQCVPLVHHIQVEIETPAGEIPGT